VSELVEERMAGSILYRFEDCFNEALRKELLNKISFDDVPAKVLQVILNSDDDVGGDEDDYAVMAAAKDTTGEEESQWWNENKIDQLTVDQFTEQFVRTKLFQRTVRKLLDPIFSPSKMDALQLADAGEDLLASIEECDASDHHDILKLRKVDLVKVDKDVPGSSISAKYTASFEFETLGNSKGKRYVNTFFNTGSLCLLFASLGELGSTGNTNNTTQNSIQVGDACYEIGVNGDLVTWGSKLRFLKNELVSVILDAKYLWKCMMEEPEHPFFKECHPARNAGSVQTKLFLRRYAYRFSMRHSSEITEKQMLPKIRHSKASGKQYMKFTMSVLRRAGVKEKRKKVDEKNHVTDPSLRSTLEKELQISQQKIYRYFQVYLHGLLGKKKLNHHRREELGYGDLIRFCVSATCYCDSQKNVFTVLHSPRGSAEVLLRGMYLRNVSEGAEMSKPKVDPRLQQIALKNMINNEDDGADFNELFNNTETLPFTQRKQLTYGDFDKDSFNAGEDDDSDGCTSKKMRRLTDEPFQYNNA
jgi:hypothetical protein